MGYIESTEELMNHIKKMDHDNSVLQFTIQGKGKFTLVLQEIDDSSIKSDTEKNPQLKQMIEESKKAYGNGEGLSTSQIVDSLSVEDFE